MKLNIVTNRIGFSIRFVSIWYWNYGWILFWRKDSVWI